HALRRAGSEVDVVHLTRLIEDPTRLDAYRMVVIPGGFTYGDDIAAGTVFSVEMRARVLPALRARIADGVLVLGICNGFQILTRAGLLPDGTDAPTASLAPNESGRFECRWVRLEALTDHCAFLERGQIIECPVAHAEGRFVTTDDSHRARLREAGQIALRYVGPDDGVAAYPWNPNGSHDGIAGVCDASGRVLGLMPHPERNVEAWHHPHWTRGTEAAGAGIALFERGVRAARGDA
ncbi:MAG TPA: phosphoribosylformylglycinamidine synthase I, partial [Myxococcota bacterium]